MENKKVDLELAKRVLGIIREGYDKRLGVNTIIKEITEAETDYPIKRAKIIDTLNLLWKKDGKTGFYKSTEKKAGQKTPRKPIESDAGERRSPARTLPPVYSGRSARAYDVPPDASISMPFRKSSQPATPDEIDFLYPRMISIPTAGKSYFLAGTGVCKFVYNLLVPQFGNRPTIPLPSPCKTVLRGLVTDQHMDRIISGFKNARKDMIQSGVPEKMFNELNEMVHSPDIEEIVSALHVLHRQNGDKGPLVESEDERFKNLARKAQDFFAQEYATVKNVTHEAALLIVQEKTAPGFVPVCSDEGPGNQGPMAIIG